MNRKLQFLLVLTFFIKTSFAQLPNKAVDVLHYRYTLSINDTNNIITGQAEITVKLNESVNKLSFDLMQLDTSGKGMTVTSVKQDGNAVPFTQQPQQLIINKSAQANQQVIYSISYYGEPDDGFIISTNKFGKRTFFSDNWPNRAHHWIPCMDHPSDKATVEFIVTAPEHYQVVSNGLQVEENSLYGGLKQTHWKEDVAISTKIFALGAADFAVNYPGNVNCIPLYSWIYPEQKEQGFKDYALAKNILPWYIEKVGPYAYEKLANIQSKTIFGGVENAGAVFYSEKSVSDKGIESLLAHELAHQWFGDAASETDWPHLWLSEGFATYMTQLYLEHKYGVDTLRAGMAEDRKEVIKLSKKRITPVVDTSGITNPMGLLNANSYQKGGWVLHMLRRKIGDVLFWKSIRAYYAKYNGSNASTEDLRMIFEQQSGQDLKAFFDQWLYTPGQPKLTIEWKYDQQKKQLSFKIDQLQNKPFIFPLKVLVKAANNTKIFVIEINKKITTKIFPLNFRPTSVFADPNVDLLFEAMISEQL